MEFYNLQGVTLLEHARTKTDVHCIWELFKFLTGSGVTDDLAFFIPDALETPFQAAALLNTEVCMLPDKLIIYTGIDLGTLGHQRYRYLGIC